MSDSFKVCSELKLSEIDDEECKIPAPTIEVCDHWTNPSLVVLVIDGKKYALNGNQLARAIKVAQIAHG